MIPCLQSAGGGFDTYSPPEEDSIFSLKKFLFDPNCPLLRPAAAHLSNAVLPSPYTLNPTPYTNTARRRPNAEGRTPNAEGRRPKTEHRVMSYSVCISRAPSPSFFKSARSRLP